MLESMAMRKLRQHVGTILIILSFVSLLFLTLPLLRVYFFTPPVTIATTPSDAFTLMIPRINASVTVLPQVDPWNQRTYNEALKMGVAHAKGTGLPGENKTVFLFAHSTGEPWNQLFYNTVFLRLGELQKGDEIVIDYNRKRYRYTVRDTKEVWPSETRYLTQTDKNQLILQTCTPIGTTLKRLLVFAEPEKQ